MIRPIVPLVEYGFKYDYFSKVLCINKDKPELQCNGKCQLSKKLKETAPVKSDNNTPLIPTINLDDYPITYLHSYKYCLVSSDFSGKIDSDGVEINKCKNYINSVFRPPQTIV